MNGAPSARFPPLSMGPATNTEIRGLRRRTRHSMRVPSRRRDSWIVEWAARVGRAEAIAVPAITRFHTPLSSPRCHTAKRRGNGSLADGSSLHFARMRIGVDTGGTFTDFVALDRGSV